MDIRLSHKFFTHIKTKRLAKRLGDGAVLGLIKLWTYAAEHFQKGDISELSNDEISMIAEVDIDPDRFVETLIELRFLDIEGGRKKLHEWKEHQPYAYFAEERSKIAKQNIEKRWKAVEKATEKKTEKEKILKYLSQYIDAEAVQKLRDLNETQLDRLLFLFEDNRLQLNRISDIYAYTRSLDEPSGYISFTERRKREREWKEMQDSEKRKRSEPPPDERVSQNEIQNLMQILK